MTFVDAVNLSFYETHFGNEGLIHRYPRLDTVRCEIWYFRQRRRPGTLLDYGFGYGQEMIYFAENGYEVYGLDIAPTALARIEKMLQGRHAHLADRIHARLLASTDDRLPFPDAFFDFIHSNQVIYHLPSESAVKALLAEWHRVLKPGGLLMFSAVGPDNTVIADGKEVAPNVYEVVSETPNSQPQKMRCVLMRDAATVRQWCAAFQVHEVGWFTSHYCGVDGFHWQVLAEKRS